MSLLAVLLPAVWLGALGVSAQENDAPFELPPAPATSTSTPRADFSSDRFEYVESSSTIRLEGHAIVKESSWTVRSDRLMLYLEEKRAEAFGNLQMEDGTSLAFGESGEFDFEEKKGRLKDAWAGFAPWRIHGDSARMEPDHWIHFKSASFTSCNSDESPHYHFRSSSVHVHPHDWLYAWNTVFFLRRVPLFYMPFFWKSLRRKHILHTRFQPGYDRRNGAFLKTSTLYDVGPYLHGKLFVDYFGHQGLGAGNELDLRQPGVGNGALYGYGIREKRSGKERWALLGDDFHVLPSSAAFQMRLQAQSDPNFNNDYNRSNSFAVTQQLVNSAAFVRNTRTTITRISYSRSDQQNPALQRFEKTQEHLPRLDFQTAPLSLGPLPWLNTFTGFADNSFDIYRGFMQRSAGAGWQGRKALPIVRGVSFEPTAGLSETYESRRDWMAAASTMTYVDAFTARYNVGGDLRWNSPVGIWDLAETFGQRMVPGTVNVDTAAQDRGIETNLTTLSHTLRPLRTVYTRLQTGYDWRDFRDRLVSFRERVQPFAADVVWQARPKWSLLAHDSYQLDRGNETFAVQSDWGERGGTFFGLGFNNNLATARHFFASEEFALASSSGTWKIGGVLRQDIRDARGGFHLDSVSLYDKELSLQKTWHDFTTRTTFRIRPGGVKEASFRVELKLDAKRPVGPSSPESTPWRPWKSDD